MSKIKPQTIVAIAITLCIVCTILYSFMKPSSNTVVSSEKKEKEKEKVVDVESKEEMVKAVEELETIKDRLKNAENYREYYRSETNNGLTVIGTMMEQMIDVMVAVLKQPLVAEAVAKRIVNKQDADEMAEYIEVLGQGIVKEVEETPILKCRKSRTYVPCTTGGTESCGWVEAEGEVPTENCVAYEVNHMAIREGSRNAAANLYNKVLDIVTKVEEQDKIYRITKNVALDNATQFAIANNWNDRDIERMHEGFPDQNEFTDAALGHYKYLGHDLRLELGESVNTIELTDDEKSYLPHHMKNRNIEEEIKAQKFFDISIELYEEADYKGNEIVIQAKFPEGTDYKLNHSHSNPLKSFKISENVILFGRRRDTQEEVKIKGPAEDSDHEEGLIDTRIEIVQTN
tara:strand:- start:3044 stop:4249 length:1206 start_codon:yes stop_codon:yes gene_type:complete